MSENKTECSCGGNCACNSKQEFSQEELVHSLNVLMNALIGVLVDKKVLSESEIHEKLVKEFGAMPVESHLESH